MQRSKEYEEEKDREDAIGRETVEEAMKEKIQLAKRVKQDLLGWWNFYQPLRSLSDGHLLMIT